MTLYRCLSSAFRMYGRVVAGIMAILLVTLAGCSFPGTAPATVPTPTPTLPPVSQFLQFVTFDLGLPAKALNAPIVGTVPDNGPMHVVITFRVNQSVLNQLQTQKVKPGQSINLQDLANKIGISDTTYEAIGN